MVKIDAVDRWAGWQNLNIDQHHALNGGADANHVVVNGDLIGRRPFVPRAHKVMGRTLIEDKEMEELREQPQLSHHASFVGVHTGTQERFTQLSVPDRPSGQALSGSQWLA